MPRSEQHQKRRGAANVATSGSVHKKPFAHEIPQLKKLRDEEPPSYGAENKSPGAAPAYKAKGKALALTLETAPSTPPAYSGPVTATAVKKQHLPSLDGQLAVRNKIQVEEVKVPAIKLLYNYPHKIKNGYPVPDVLPEFVWAENINQLEIDNSAARDNLAALKVLQDTATEADKQEFYLRWMKQVEDSIKAKNAMKGVYDSYCDAIDIVYFDKEGNFYPRPQERLSFKEDFERAAKGISDALKKALKAVEVLEKPYQSLI